MTGVSYSSQLLKVAEGEVAIASGTVFNHVLLWSVCLRGESEASSPVCLELQGHEVSEGRYDCSHLALSLSLSPCSARGLSLP